MERRTIRIKIPPPVSQSGKVNNPKSLKGTQDPSTGAGMEALKIMLENLSTDMKAMTTKMSNIELLQTEVKNDVAALRTEVTNYKAELKNDIAEHNLRIEAVEQTVAVMEERESILIKVVKKLSTKQAKADRRLNYAETKSRETNIRISNVEYRHDIPDMKACVAEIIREVLDIPKEALIIKNAHRVGNAYGNTPAYIVVRFDTRDMKQQVLSTAWGLKKLEYHDRRIYFEQDYTSEIQDLRKGYKKIRAHLKKHDIGSYIKAPAKLKVFNGGDVTIYNSSREAEEAYNIYDPEEHEDDLDDWEAQLRKLSWEKVKR